MSEVISPEKRVYATAWQEVKGRLGVDHPAKQLVIILDRLDRLEKLIADMLRQPSEPVIAKEIIPVQVPVIKNKGGRPRKVAV